MQSLVVALILLLCVAYAARRIWRRLTAPPQGDVRCEGCPLADTCKHHGHHTDCPQGAKCDCCK